MTLEHLFSSRADRLKALLVWEKYSTEPETSSASHVSTLPDSIWHQVWLQTLQSEELMTNDDIETVIEGQYRQNSPLHLNNLTRSLPYDRTQILIDQIQGMLACAKVLSLSESLGQNINPAWAAKDQLHALLCNYLIRQPLLESRLHWSDRSVAYELAVETYQLVLDNTRPDDLPTKFEFHPSTKHLNAMRLSIELTMQALVWQQAHFCVGPEKRDRDALEQDCSVWWQTVGAEMAKIW